MKQESPCFSYGECQAGEQAPVIKVCGVRPLDGHRLWVRFSMGEIKVFDFTSLLAMPAFAAFADEAVFRNVYIDYGVTVWDDGAIDIAPELLYKEGIPIEEIATA